MRWAEEFSQPRFVELGSGELDDGDMCVEVYGLLQHIRKGMHGHMWGCERLQVRRPMMCGGWRCVLGPMG